MHRRANYKASRILRAIPIAVLASVASATVPAALLTPASAAGLLPTTTTVAASPAASTQGDLVTMTASVKVLGLPGLGITPTGSVTFTAFVGSSSTTLGSAKIGSCLLTTCTAVLTSSSLAVGTNTITAAYAGDTLAAASSGSTTETVTSRFIVGTPANPVTVTCTAGPCTTGEVYSNDGASQPFGHPSSSVDVASHGSTGSNTLTASLGGPSLPCSLPGIGQTGNFTSTAADVGKSVEWDVFGPDADQEEQDILNEGNFTYICFESPTEFTAYYATNDVYTDTSSDFANYGAVPFDASAPYGGGYVGLLPPCGSEAAPPCYTSSFYSTNNDFGNYFGDVINTPAGDPHIGGG
jgi:hypothetical protein